MVNFIEKQNLSNKTVVITGGAGYIGSTLAEAFAQLHANLALVDINEKVYEVAKALQNKYGIKAKGYCEDLSLKQEIFDLPQKINNDFGSLDHIINNAGFVGTSNLTGWVEPFEKQSYETYKLAVDMNLATPIFLIQAALPFLRESNNPSIVNIGSIYGFLGPDMSLYNDTKMGNPIAYAASKGGLIQATKWLSTVLAPKIRVNSVSPGGLFRNQDPKFVKRYELKTPLQRMATEEDIVGIVVFLCTDLAQYITGQHIAVDGGFSAW